MTNSTLIDNNAKIIKELSEGEIKEGLYEETVLGLPIWRLLRFEYRISHLKKVTGFTNRTKRAKPNYFHLLGSYFKSLFQVIILIMKKGNKRKYIFFAFPRLVKFGNEYIDKFTDPVIENANLNDHAIIFQRSLGGSHLRPRGRVGKVIYTDFIDITSRVISIIFFPLFFLLFYKKILRLYSRIQKVYSVKKKDVINVSRAIGFLLCSYFIYKIILEAVKPRKTFMVDREIFIPQILWAKRNNVAVYELQHGITQSETVLYTGEYNIYADPDRFLAFGEEWINPYFGINRSKIVNIGWAYQSYIQKKVGDSEMYDKDTFLVISSPAITNNILNFVIAGIAYNSNFKFNIRLHPQEDLTKEQYVLIKDYRNISIVDNSLDSIYSVASHLNVVGDNSSVLYEAISCGKNVGKINMMGLSPLNLEADRKKGFKIISDFADLLSFTKENTTSVKITEGLYSEFKIDVFNEIIK